MLLPAIKEGVDLVPATEIMIVNPPIRKLISDGEDVRVGEVITTSGAEGMHDFTQSFAELVSNNLVEKSVALEAAHNPEALEMALKGITAETRMF
jgi:Tfp pilus assembly pilus retraction ATPase PilT